MAARSRKHLSLVPTEATETAETAESTGAAENTQTSETSEAAPGTPQVTVDAPEVPGLAVELKEAPPEDPRIAELRAHVQELLDRFAAHRFPLVYETVVTLAERVLLQTLISEGVLDRDEVVRRSLALQASLLQSEFQARCVKRDEARLAKPHRGPNDQAGRTARQIMLARKPDLILPEHLRNEKSRDRHD